jgi:hypothetical protein
MLATMRMKRYFSVLLGLFLGGLMPFSATAGSGITEYFGTCDASAAAVIGEGQFVVASDEDNVLRVYRLDNTHAPVSTLDLTDFLKSDVKHPEADIEGAARVGDSIYWISSHGANSNGKSRPGRRRFFATQVRVAGDSVTLTPVGAPYENLVRDIARLPALKDDNLAAAAKIAPKQAGGLNIEGLSATPRGALLIGLRNPVPNGKALLIPLENPDEVIAGKAAILGSPIRLSLGGRGVRSMEYAPVLGRYLIVAGTAGEGGKFQLYQWSGVPAEDALPVGGVDFSGLQPEGMIVYPGDKVQVQIFSDDGTKMIGGKICKDSAVGNRRFRTIWVAF